MSLQEAAQASAPLAALAALARESSQRLKAIEHLLAPALRSAIQAGPIDGSGWCLLVTGNAAAAKLRQLLPALQAALRQRGWAVDSIRIKVLTGSR